MKVSPILDKSVLTAQLIFGKQFRGLQKLRKEKIVPKLEIYRKSNSGVNK